MGGWPNASANGRWKITAGPPDTRPFYAAVGDSYSSGEGSGDYDAFQRNCHRGADAWPRLVARDLPRSLRMESYDLIACSGADSDALLGHETAKGQPAQLKVLAGIWPLPSLITVTEGGNDVGFAGVLENCLFFYCAENGTLDKAEAKIGREEPILVKDYRAIKAADPRATLVVVGYPRLFPGKESQVIPLCGTTWLVDATRAGLNKLDAELDDVIKKAAGAAGVRYFDVTNALNGHEACTKDSWIYSIGWFDPTREWFQQDGHPTTPGQRKIASIVSAYVKRLLPA